MIIFYRAYERSPFIVVGDNNNAECIFEGLNLNAAIKKVNERTAIISDGQSDPFNLWVTKCRLEDECVVNLGVVYETKML